MDAARKERNDEIKARFKEELKQWDTERDRAKQVKQKPGWKKPTRGKLLPPIPKPAKVVPEPDDNEPDKSSDDDGDNDNDD